MPLIDPSQFKSVHSYQGPTVPDYNFLNKGFDTIGSKDTILNRLSGSYYDESFSPYRDQNDQRYLNQNFLSYIGNNTAALGAKTFIEGIPSIVGSLTSLAASPLALSENISFSDVFEFNPVNQAAKYVAHTIDDLTPRFQASDFNEQSFLEQLKRPGELLSQNIDSLAFLAQSFAAGGALSKLGIGAKLATKVSKARPDVYAAQANRAAVGEAIDFYSSVGLLTTNEAALEGKDAKEQISNKLQQERLQGLNTLTDEEIEATSKQAFSNVFWTNMITGSVTNGVFMKLLSPLYKAPLASRANEFALKMSKDGLEKQAVKGLEAFFFDKGNTLGRVTLGLAEQVLSEGTEESIQYSIQEAGALDGKKTSFLDSFSKVVDDITSLEIYNLSDKDRAKAFGLGALIGGVSTGAANFISDGNGGRLGAAGQAANYRKSQEDAISKYNKAYTNLVDNGLALKSPSKKASVYQDGETGAYTYKDDEGTKIITPEEYSSYIKENSLPPEGGEFQTKSTYQFDSEGRVVPDPVAIAKLQIDASLASTISELIDNEVATTNDPLKVTLYRNELLSNLAIQAFESGTTDILLENLDKIAESPLPFVDGDPAAEATYMKEFVSQLETNYLNVKNYFVPTSTDPKYLKDLETRKSLYLSKSNRLLTLNELFNRKATQVTELERSLLPKFTRQNLDALKSALANNEPHKAIFSLQEEKKGSIIDALDEIDKSPLLPYAKTLSNLKILEDTISSYERDLSNILADSKWAKKDPIVNPYEGPLKVNILSVDKDTFESHVLRQVIKRSHQNKQKALYQAINSDVVNRIIANSINNPASTVEQVGLLVERILANDLALTEEAKEVLYNYTLDTINRISELSNTLTDEVIPYYGADLLPSQLHTVESFTLEDAPPALLKSLEYYKEMKQGIDKLVNLDPSKIKTSVSKPQSSLQIVESLYEELLNGARSLIDEGFIGFTPSENFIDDVSVEYEINVLNKLQSLLPKGKSTEKIPELLDKLSILLKAAISNKENRSLEDARETSYHNEAIINLSNHPSFSSSFTQNELDQLSSEDIEPAAKAAFVLDKLKGEKLPDLTTLAYSIYDTLYNRYPRLGSIKLDKIAFEGITHSPNKLLTHIFNQIATNSNGQLPDLENFAKTFNVSRFLSSKSLLSLEEKQALVDLYLQASSLALLKAHSTSPISARTILERMKKALVDAKLSSEAGRASVFPPSISQERLLRELIILSSQAKINDPSIFHNVVGIKSPAGAGKSTVMTPIALSVLGYSPDEILTSANKQLAAENIQASVPTSHGIFTASQLLELFQSKNIPPSVKLIIVDEAGGMDQVTLYKLAGAFTKYQLENQDKSVKMWMIYDTNQSGNSATGISSLDLGYTYSPYPAYREAKERQRQGLATKEDLQIIYTEEKGQLPIPRGITPFIENLQVVSPITTSYRSSIATIANSMNSFLTATEVTSIPSSLSQDINDLSGIQGVFAQSTSPQTAYTVIRKHASLSKQVNPSRSRIIITTQSRKSLYSDMGVIVATPEEAAGRSYDEVFVDYPNEGQATPAYNRDMYTALSRAREFIFTTSVSGKNDIDPSIPQKAKLQTASLKADYNSAIEQKSKELNSYDILAKNTPSVKEDKPAKASEVSEKTEEPDTSTQELEIPQAEVIKVEPSNMETPYVEDYIATVEEELITNTQEWEDGVQVVVEDGSFKEEISHPRNQAFREAQVQVGDEIVIINHQSNGLNRFVALKLFNDVYHELGVISDNSLANFPLSTQDSLKALAPVAASVYSTESGKLYEMPASFQSLSARVGQGSNPLTFKYDHSTPTIYESSHDLINLVSSFLTDFSRKNPEQFTNIEEIANDPFALQTNGLPYVQAVIYTEAEAKQLNDPVIKPYVPYLKIQGIRTVSNNIVKPLQIEHRPSKFNPESSHAKKIGVEEYKMFVDKLNRFTSTLQKHPALTGTIYQYMTPDTVIDMSRVDAKDTRNKYFPFGAFVGALADAHLTKSSTVKTASDGLIATLKSKYPAMALIDLKYEDVKDLAELANELDYLVHGDSLTYEGEIQRKKDGGRIRNYRGTAQKFINRLATTNLAFESPSNVTILRDYHLNPATSKVELTGSLLLPRHKFETDTGASNNIKAAPELIQKLRAKYESLVRRNKDASPIGNALKQITESVDKGGDFHFTPMSIPSMESLLQAKDLYNPLHFSSFSSTRNQVNEDGRSILEDSGIVELLETSFSGIIPSRLVVTTEVEKGELFPQPANVENDEANVRRQIVERFRENVPVEKIKEEFSYYPEVNSLIDKLQQEFVYQTRSNLILSEISRVLKLSSLKDKLEQLLTFSDSVLEFDKKKGLVSAPRDYIRAFIFSEINPTLSPKEALDLANKFWYKDKEDNFFDEALDVELRSYLTTQMLDKLVKLEEVIKQLGTYSPKSGSPLHRINAIVSTIRELSKSGVRTVQLDEQSSSTLDLLLGITLENYTSDWVKESIKLLDNPSINEMYNLALEDEEYVASLISMLEDLKQSQDVAVIRDLSYSINPSELGRDLTPTEARAYFNSLVKPSVVQRLRKLFNSKKGRDFRIVSLNHMIHSLGKNNWGLFKDGVVYVVQNEGKVKSKVVAHEAFHKVVWNYLSPLERIALFDLAKQKYGAKDSVTLEEDLANDFMNYVRKPKSFKGKLYEIFRKILNFFGFTYNNLSSLEAFFDELSSGMISGEYSTSDQERDLAERWPNVEQYVIARDTFLTTFDSVYTNTDSLVSFDEALEDTFDLLSKFIRGEAPLPFVTELESDLVKSSLLPIIDRRTKASSEFVQKYFKTVNIRGAKEAKISLLESRIEDLEEQLLESDEDSQDSLSNELSIAKGLLVNETLESELFDPIDKVNGRIKQKLVRLSYKGKNGPVKGDYYGIYNAILPIVASAPVSSIQEFISHLKETAVKKVGLVTEQLPSNVRRAGAKFILDSTNKINSLLQSSDKTISFFKDVNYSSEYAIVSNDGTPTLGVTRTQAINSPRYQVIPKPYGVRTKDWIKSIKDTPQAYDSYRLFEELTFLKSLASSTASLVKANPFVAISQYRNYEFRHTYSSNRIAGKEAIIESKIKNSIIDSISSPKASLFADPQLSQKLEGDLSSQKLGIKNFLLSLKIPFSFVDSPSTSPQTINQIATFLKFLKPRIEAAFNEYKEEKDFTKLYDFVNDENSTISALVDAMSSSSSAVEVNNYIKSDGKRAFLYREASFQTFVANFLTTMSGTTDHLYFENGQLKTRAKILSSNKFVNGAKIFSHIIHDGRKTKGNEKYAVSLTSEKPRDYFERTFKDGFLSRIRSSSGKTYYQFLPIPSNRTTISAFEVKPEVNLDSQIMSIIEAEKNRPAPSEFSRNKQYARNYDQFRFPGLSGKAEGDTKVLLQKVKDHIKESAKKAAEEYLSYSPKFDKRDIDASVFSFTLKIPGFITKKDLDSKLKALRASKKRKTIEEIAVINSEIETLKNDASAADLKAVEALMEIFYANHIVNQYSLSQLIYSDESFYADKEAQTKRIQSATGSGEVVLSDILTGYHKDNPIASNVLVIDDLSTTLPDYLEDYRPASYKQEFDETDAQGFITPQMYELLSSAMGAENSADIVLKPLHYSITESGEVKLIKFSTTVITDEFIEGIRSLPKGDERVKFFEDLRNKMNASQIGMAVFQTAFKLGSTNKAAKIINDSINDGPILDDNIVKINPSFTRFQLNPSAEVDTDVANFSQGTAMANTNGLNEGEAHFLHTLNQHQISIGMSSLRLDLALTSLNTPSSHTEKKLRSLIIEKAETTSSSVNDLLRYRGSATSPPISLNAPLIHAKLVSMITSTVSSPTVGFRIPGSKLVIQSEVGTYSAASSRLQWKDKDGYTEVLLPESYRGFFQEGDTVVPGKSIIGFRIPTSNTHSLQVLKVKGFYKTPPNALGNVIIAPREMVYITGNDFDVDSLFLVRKTIFTQAEELNFSNYGIPYSVKRGEVMGFKNDKPVIISGKTIAQLLEAKAHEYLDKIDQLRELPKTKETGLEIVSLTKEVKSMLSNAREITNNLIVDTMSGILLDKKNRYDLNTPITLDRVKRTKGDTKKDLIRDFDSLLPELKKITSEEYLDVNSFISKIEESGMESIVSSETEMGKRIIARYDYPNHPLSVMEMLAQEKSPKDGYWTLKEVEAVLYPKGQLTDYLVQKEIHKNTYSGLKITGITANFAKTVAYLFHGANITSALYNGKEYEAGSPETISLLSSLGLTSLEQLVEADSSARVISKDVPTLREGLGLRINKGVYNSLSRNERKVVEEDGKYTLKDIYEGFRPVNIFETLDTILNLAIDNVKEQKLSFLGINNANSNLYLSSIALGVPLNDVVKMFNSAKITSFNEKGLKEELDRLTNVLRGMSIDELVEAAKDTLMSGVINKNTLANDYTVDNFIKQFSKKGYYSTTIDSPLNDYLLILQLQKLQEIGSSFFEDAQIISSLRKTPNKKWKLDYLIDKYLKKTSESTKKVFSNVSLSNIPHVANSVKVMQTTKKLLENSILLHRTEFVELAKKVMDKTKMANTFISQEQSESIQIEFVKMLTSDLTLTVDGATHSLNLPSKTYTSKAGITLYGAEAFSQEFIDRVSKAIIRNPDNEFLQSLEIYTDSTGISRLDITASKTGQEEIDIRLKDAFKSLMDSDLELAIDFVRYELIQRGLVFGRTSISSLFPPRLISGITSTLDQRLTKFLSHEEYRERLFKIFIPQFVRNNASSLRFLPKDSGVYPKPETTGFFTSLGGSTVITTSGEKNGIYFDLAYPKSTNPNYAYFDIIKRFGEDTYIKIFEDDSTVYYRYYSYGMIYKNYSFEEKFFDSVYNEDLLLNPNIPVIRNYYGSGTIYHETGVEQFKPGDTIYLVDKSSSFPLYLDKVEIVSSKEARAKIAYQTKFIERIPLMTTSTSVEVPMELVQTAANPQDTIFLADVTSSTPVISIPGIKDSIYLGGSPEEMEVIISNLPSRIVIDQSILTKMYSSYPVEVIRIARLLESKTGYRDPILDRESGIDPVKYVKLVALETSSKVHFTSNGQFVRARLSTPEGRSITKGDIIQLGVTQAGTYLFAMVDDVIGLSTKVRVFGPEVFSQLNETASNFEEVYSKIC